MKPNKNETKYLKTLGGALFLAMLPGIVVPAYAADAPATATQAQTEEVALTVLARDGVKSADSSIGQLDLGNVDSLSQPKIEQDFILRNDRKAPITVGRLQPTCGCTSVILGEGTDATKTLAPGEEVKVRVSVDVTRFHGPIHKAVRAYAADGATLLATMEITANIQDPVTLSTRQIDLGRVNFGTPISAPLTVTLSPRLLTGDNALKLVSSDANVTVTPSQEKPAPGTDPMERRYVVAISPKAPIGLISSTLSFVVPEKSAAKVVGPATVPSTPAEAPDKSEDNRLAAALQTTQVAVNAEVVGNLRATPTMVVFGKQPTQRIVLTGNTADALKGLKLSSPSPWVKARLVPPPKSAPGQAKTAAKTAIFELTLDPHAPVGALETQVIVTAADGERLNLPVLADIVAPSPAPPA